MAHKIFLSVVFLTQTCFAQGISREASHSSAISRPTVTSQHSQVHTEAPSTVDLEMYLQVLNEREAVLTAANESLLHEANYSLVKVPLFALKGAMDGYFLGRILGVGGAAATAAQAGTQVVQKSISERALHWIANGGLDKMKSFGFNVGVLGVSAANNAAVLKGYRWQYGIPILGTALAAYSWSDQLMNSADLIEKHGKEILAIRAEKHRIRTQLEKQRSH
ncbi:hypothetical protein EBR03_02610 [bacterium]|nr:hypothetical protein [bacterium]NBW98443.1 hypothetical protein [bacterium]NBX83841.1 hypothetical protein [bacterium]